MADSINTLEDELDDKFVDIEFDVTEDPESIDVGSLIDTDNRTKTIRNLEDELAPGRWRPGTLSDYDIHVFPFMKGDFRDEFGGAGFNIWMAGDSSPNDDDPDGSEHTKYVPDNFDRRFSGSGYAFAFVNRWTPPGFSTDDLRRNTTMHEVLHCFNVEHRDGGITRNGGGIGGIGEKAYVSPMATWYIEGITHPGSGTPDIDFEDFCNDGSDKNRYSHTSEITDCTADQVDDWIDEYY